MCPVQTVTYVSGCSPSIYAGISNSAGRHNHPQEAVCQEFAKNPGKLI